MTTTEHRQIPPPSHFSASPKNRSSGAHGEIFWPDICSGRSSRHVIFFFYFDTMCRPPRVTCNPRSVLTPKKRTSHPPLRCYLSPPLSSSTSHPTVLNSSIPAYEKRAGLKSTSSGPADMYSNLVSAVEDSEVFTLKITERAVCAGSEEKGGGTRRKKQR